MHRVDESGMCSTALLFADIAAAVPNCTHAARVEGGWAALSVRVRRTCEVGVELVALSV